MQTTGREAENGFDEFAPVAMDATPDSVDGRGGVVRA
jgi:hypothetical protein